MVGSLPPDPTATQKQTTTIAAHTHTHTHRSLQLQYKGKNKTPTFKQLEGVIRNINPATKKSGAFFWLACFGLASHNPTLTCMDSNHHSERLDPSHSPTLTYLKSSNQPTKKHTESLSHKCQDLNQFIPQATGISPYVFIFFPSFPISHHVHTIVFLGCWLCV